MLTGAVMKYAAEVGFPIAPEHATDELLEGGVRALRDTVEILHGLEHPIARIREDNTMQFLNNAFMRYAQVDGLGKTSMLVLRETYFDRKITDCIRPGEHERFERAKVAVKDLRRKHVRIGRHLIEMTHQFTFVSYKGAETPMRVSMTYSLNYETYQMSFTDIRDLREAERKLLSANVELGEANERLRQEADDRAKVIAQLEEALANVKTLEGLIPICAWCKRVRDDQGYWEQVEVFVKERSGAEFSHGICPDCATKLGDDPITEP